MSAKLVPTIKTTYNKSEMISGFVNGWIKQFGKLPSKESIGVLYAQNTLETGGTSFMWNNNIGNVKFAPNSNPELDNDIEYMMLNNVWEIINGKKVIFNPPHQATWFRSFNTLEDGIAHHLNYLKNYRYKNSWIAVESGNPAQFAHLLKLRGYYSAPESDYIKLITSIYNSYMKSNDYENAISNNKQVGIWKKIGNLFSNMFK